MSSTSSSSPLRADAERNRRRILEASARVFAERGLDVSMEDLAAAAGVGVGTLYRRFADRETLIDALFEERIGEVAALAQAGLDAEDAWTGLVGFIRAVVALQAEDRGLREALLSSSRGRDRVRAARERVGPIVAELVERAKRSGALREDLDLFDVPMMQFALGNLADLTRDVAPQFHQRLLAIFVDGLAADAARTAMPAPPLTPAEMVSALARPR